LPANNHPDASSFQLSATAKTSPAAVLLQGKNENAMSVIKIIAPWSSRRCAKFFLRAGTTFRPTMHARGKT